MARPLIAVTGPRRGARGPRACVAAALYLSGAKPLQLRPGDAWQDAGHDGVVVTGGHDVDPVLYAAEAEVEPRYDRERDRFESAVIEDALARDLPLLGICRGMQLLNVILGGTLFQDLRPHRQQTSHRRTVLPLKTVLLDAGTRLAGLVGADRMKVNSLHNQAIDRVGESLRIAAHDLDGIVQAIEAPARRFALGVQWHPEFLLLSARQRRLFAALARAADD